jgi:hypothetical protein
VEERKPPRKFAWLCIISVALTFAAILIALWASPKATLGERYLGLCYWDCLWYQSIVETGYHSPVPPVGQKPWVSNVAFFPGYPMLARSIFLALHLSDGRVPLLIVAQLGSCLFWLALLLILERWKVRRGVQALVIASVFAHPAGFYLILGYSESLFLASMLLYLYGADAPDPKKRWLAVLPGFVMAATRVVGVPIAAYPVFRWLAQRREFRHPDFQSAIQPAAITILSSLGCLLFLAYCQLQFGDYSLYMLTQKIGWGISPDYGALWKWPSFRYSSEYERFATLASVVGLSALFGAELVRAALSRSRPSEVRLPLHVCAALIFYITLCGLESLWFRSMIRYTLPWWLLMGLCLAQLSTQTRLSVFKSRTTYRVAVGLGLGAWALFALWGEFHYLLVFLNGEWFA